MISTQGPTEVKAGAMAAFWGWWTKSKRGKLSSEGPGPCQPLQEQLENIFSEKRVMNHLSRTCPVQVLQQCLLNIGSNGQRQKSFLGRNHPMSTFPLIPQILLIRLEGCVSYPRVTALTSHIPPTIPYSQAPPPRMDRKNLTRMYP